MIIISWRVQTFCQRNHDDWSIAIYIIKFRGCKLRNVRVIVERIHRWPLTSVVSGLLTTLKRPCVSNYQEIKPPLRSNANNCLFKSWSLDFGKFPSRMLCSVIFWKREFDRRYRWTLSLFDVERWFNRNFQLIFTPDLETNLSDQSS